VKMASAMYLKTILQCKEFQNREEQKKYLTLLAEVWLTHFLSPVHATHRTRKGIPSTTMTPTYDDTATLIESAKRGEQPALRTLLERRQGGKCAVSRVYTLDAPPPVDEDYERGTLIASHILPYSMNEFPEKGDKFKKAVITWDMLRSWTSFDVTKLSGEKINGPSNAILLSGNLDGIFGNFKWWFDATEVENTYTVSSNYKIGHNDKRVAFSNCDDSEDIDLPDPQILKIHAAFCRVFHASGAAEFFDRIWRDMDITRVLSNDGSTNISALLNLSFPVCV